MRMSRCLKRVIGLTALLLAAPVVNGQPQGTMVDLGTLGGGQSAAGGSTTAARWSGPPWRLSANAAHFSMRRGW